MFLERETLNPNNKNYLSKTKDLSYNIYVIHDFNTTVIATLIFLANKQTPAPIINT